MRRLIAKNHSV